MEVAMKITGSIAVMLALASHPGWAVAGEAAARPAVKPEFGQIDSNGNGSISPQELISAGMDDLAFRAMDINGDGNLSAEEYARRQALEEQPAGTSDRQPVKRR
jgi:hypothetical protein